MARLFTLRTRFLLAAITLLLVSAGLMLVYIHTSLQTTLSKEMQKRGVAIANSFARMATNPSLTENLIQLQLLAIEFKNSEEDIEYLFTVDRHGSVVTHTVRGGFPAQLAAANPLRNGEPHRIRLISTDHGAVYDIAVPMLKGELGAAHVGISGDQLSQSVRMITMRATWLVVGLFMLVCCGAIMMASSLTRPIMELVEGVDAIGQGDLKYRIEKQGSDEIGHLAAAFNRMAESLETTTVSRNYVEQLNRELEATVTERTAQLSQANAELTKEVAERRRAEENVRQLNVSLEQRIRERTLELEVSNRELEAFCYSVSHDLRAPLRHINAYSSMIEEDYGGKLDTEGKHYLQRLAGASRQMGQLIDDLLQLSRLGRAEMRQEEVDLSGLAHGILQQLQETSPERTTTVRIEPLMAVMGDEVLIRTVLQNLLENAWKYTARQEQAVIEFGRTDDDGETVYYVRDNGIGFDMAYANKLFGVFQRLVTDSEFAGTGIGLATVHRIIQRHGGRVWAEGKPDQGATFYFTL
ncbi:MAG TPA: ATP-binding protein [Geobacteraceae bacterium]